MKVVAFGLFVLFVVSGTNACPDIIQKGQWGGLAGSSPTLPIQPAPTVVIHHSTMDACDNFVDCAGQMRDIQNIHMSSFGWNDIAYNFCIGNDGSVFAGRGWGLQGIHTPSFNIQSVGICFLGTFTSQLPSEEALAALRELIDCGITEGHIHSLYELIGHRQDVNTECPGEMLFEELQNWPRFNPGPTPYQK